MAKKRKKVNLNGSVLRLLREKKGLTQRQLADQLGYANASIVSKWENNENPIPTNLIETLTKLFDFENPSKLKEALTSENNEYAKEARLLNQSDENRTYVKKIDDWRCKVYHSDFPLLLRIIISTMPEFASNYDPRIIIVTPEKFAELGFKLEEIEQIWEQAIDNPFITRLHPEESDAILCLLQLDH